MGANLKSGVIIFHKNVGMYPKKWIDRCIKSILDQTYNDFSVYEIDYGGNGNKIYEGSIYESKEMPTHAHAHNYLLDKSFNDGCDLAFNINVDDYYHPHRFVMQVDKIKEGYDIISSNFARVNESNHIRSVLQFDRLDIESEANRGHNIIAHPVVCYSKNFWMNCDKLNPDEIPHDDFNLWKRSYSKFKFHIIPEILLYQRIHQFNISKK